MTMTSLPPLSPIAALPSPGEVVMVTPELAAEWLTHNTHNRGLKPIAIKRFAEDMTTGDWQWNGESIRFAADGTLLDGQNRLHAIVDSGEIPQPPPGRSRNRDRNGEAAAGS